MERRSFTNSDSGGAGKGAGSKDCRAVCPGKYQETGDAGNLGRQSERLREYAAGNGFQITLETSDVASGLNTKRRGLQKAIEAARRGEIRFLVIEYPDRLARFGYEYLLDLLAVQSDPKVGGSAD